MKPGHELALVGLLLAMGERENLGHVSGGYPMNMTKKQRDSKRKKNKQARRARKRARKNK